VRSISPLHGLRQHCYTTRRPTLRRLFNLVLWPLVGILSVLTVLALGAHLDIRADAQLRQDRMREMGRTALVSATQGPQSQTGQAAVVAAFEHGLSEGATRCGRGQP
jgi:hypothetical protein